jgi:hypothetical protein
MIDESSAWLAKPFGHSEAYWDGRKRELAEAFHLLDPNSQLTAVARHMRETLLTHGYQPNPSHAGLIPEYQDGKGDLLHLFPTQFDEFGQRVHSGVSLLSWSDNAQLDLLTEHRVTALIRLLTRMPYEPEQIANFVDHFRRHDLLTEQHLAGGCLLGEALDRGLEDPARTGLPRVSPHRTRAKGMAEVNLV